MNKRFGDTTPLCKDADCPLNKTCLHFLAFIEKRHELKGNETYVEPHKTTVVCGDKADSCNISYKEECDNYIEIKLPTPHYSTDCLYCSTCGYCYKHHANVCQMECKHCGDFKYNIIDTTL